MEKDYIPSTGANESHYDPRTRRHDTTAAAPLVTGGISYLPDDIEHQHNVGICTAASVVQNAQKAKGKKYSLDFQYLLQKKYYDLNWDEGSSIFSALKVAKNYGFLPRELFTWATEADRNLSYAQYVAKLRAVPDSEVARLISLCVDKLAGYAQLPTDAQSLAKGISDSVSGVICRYEVGEEWWTARDGRISWATADIDPLRPPAQVISGHGIGSSRFDFSVTQNVEHPNTWGILWNDKNQGRGNANHLTYKCTEAWIPYYDAAPTPTPQPFIFTQDMQYGQTTQDIVQLQKRLGVAPTSGYYGPITKQAVLAYQIAKGIPLSWYERYWLAGSVCGAKTRAALNSEV